MAQSISSQALICTYLQDAIALERAHASKLDSLSTEEADSETQQLFRQHAAETKSQEERLTSRLKQLGGSPSTIKSVFAHLFSIAPKVGALAHSAVNRDLHHLILAYAAEQSEVAMYEAIKVAAQTVGDVQTSGLIDEIQGEEHLTAQKIWSLIAQNTKNSVERQTREEWAPKGEFQPRETPGQSPAA